MLLQPLLGCGQVQAGVLWWWGDLHPVVLPLLHGDTVLGRLKQNTGIQGMIITDKKAVGGGCIQDISLGHSIN